MVDQTERQRRQRQRRERRAQQRPIVQMAQPIHRVPVYELLDEDGLDVLHNASLEVLAEVGIDFYDEEARNILKAHGARVEGDTAYFEPEVIEEYVGKAPETFTQIARNEDNHLTIGGDHVTFAPVYGPPFVLDKKWGRRQATLEDFQNFIKLAYMSPYMHHSGGTIVEPTDVPAGTRHLDMIYSHIKYSDKAFMGSVTSAENAADSVRMAEILYGEDEIRENPALISLINISSPRRLDDKMLGALKVYAGARQAVIITPFILAGAMSPVTIAGTVVQQNAEALAGITFAQMVEAGTPVVYGSFLTNTDLKTGAPMFGTPESQIAIYVSAQLARRYRLPFRGGGMFASAKIPDAQAAYESVMTMIPTVQARVNFVLHAAGWLDNGLTAGYEKFVMDCELLGMYHKFLEGLDLSEDALAMESIRTVKPGGHHLGTPHTIERFRTAFFRSTLFNYDDAQTWQEKGAKDTWEIASERVKVMLAEYEAPELDPEIDAALLGFMEERRAAIAA
jgi:trimethylamine--corrinoid protein Co-methyltransferase